ncbi:hypothetical protein ACO0M4_28925 [Streptomyces sp. RGM 3693]|uniref:hypothetical protein n=1 Tax=Streptomyces sp. RGM 3693 TaxID=3413284 RepID=UPI003D26FE65
MDGQHVQRRGERVCAVALDGAGYRGAAAYAAVAPAVITHTGMAMGGLAGLTTAGQVAHAYEVPPHASAVYACMKPGRVTRLSAAGVPREPHRSR